MQSVSISDWAQAGATVVAALALLWGLYKHRMEVSDREQLARETIDAQRIEIYQRLEIESNSVFRYEAEHKNVLPLFRTHLAPAKLLESRSMDDLAGRSVSRGEAKLIARKYYEICCNLFEVAARFRQKGIFEPEVFGSWVAWYFDTVTEWGFRAVWADLRQNYTPQLRENVFDGWVARLIDEWDRPHAANHPVPTDPDEPLCMAENVVEVARAAFYNDVAAAFDCQVVRDWLKTCRNCRPIPEHPQAFR